MPASCSTSRHGSRAFLRSGVTPPGWGPTGGRHQSIYELRGEGRLGRLWAAERELLGRPENQPQRGRETNACITAASGMPQGTGIKDDAGETELEKFACRPNKEVVWFGG